MHLKIPPPLIMIFAGLLMWLVVRSGFGYPITGWFNKVGAAFFFLDGFSVMVLAVMQFKRHQTTVDPINPSDASSLVTAGIYQYTRNPMYLGMVLLLLGFGFFLGSVIATAVGLVFFVWYINTFQIAREEVALRGLFGEEYSSYCKSVRRWFGRY
ncbi:MAG: isoprenylcysteine carboxylmethyltransferase family protein [Pseudomonadota bacterium]